MSIFEKLRDAIARFKRTTQHTEHTHLADALADLVYVAEWQHNRIRVLEAKAGATPMSVGTPPAGAGSSN